MSRKNARDVAMRMLYAYDMGGFADMNEIAFDGEAEMGILSAEDQSFIASIVEGYAQKRDDIDGTIECMANGWKVGRIGRVDLAILRLATYELFYDSAIPKSVVIDEAVRLAKKYGAEKSGLFVNGVLGGIVRAQPDQDRE